MTSLDQLDTDTSIFLKLFNLILLAVTVLLGVVTFFASLNIILTLGAVVISQTLVDADSIRQKYTLVTVRNLWLLCGGAVLLGFMVGSLDYYTRNLGAVKTRRFLLWTLVIEVMIIGLSLLIAG